MLYSHTVCCTGTFFRVGEIDLDGILTREEQIRFCELRKKEDNRTEEEEKEYNKIYNTIREEYDWIDYRLEEGHVKDSFSDEEQDVIYDI